MRKAFAVFFLSLLFFSLFPGLVEAENVCIKVAREGLVPCGGPNKPDCTLCYFFVMFDTIIDFLLFCIVPPLAALMIAIGGGMYIISQGNPEMLGRAKKLFTAVVIGLLIIYGAWVIVNTFLMAIEVTVWQGPGQGWWIIPCD